MAQSTDQTTSQSGTNPNTTPAPNQPAPGGEIVITGVRAAIMKALQTKRNAQSIVDSISAEDIGKLPDSNIAEAVQRIPGVSIDREGGEGRHISINGFGPDYSLTLFNGRQIASSDATRSFSFDTIASNLVSQVDVYKTINADVPEGGLGGTIDVRTARPFDLRPGLNGSVQLSYNYDGNSKKGFPQASAVFSDRFLDGRVGILLSFTHQKRRNLDHEVTARWIPSNNAGPLDPLTNAYLADARQDAWRVIDTQSRQTISDRTRDGGTAVLQMQPTDTLILTGDYLYSKFTVKDVRDGGGAYLWAWMCTHQDANGACTQTSPGTTIDSNGFYTSLDMSGGVCPGVGQVDLRNGWCHAAGDPIRVGSFEMQHTTDQRPTTTQLAGFNAEWKPSSKFRGVFDAYWSQAVNDNKGLDTQETYEFLAQPEYTVSFPATGAPVFDLMGSSLTDPKNIQQNLWISGTTNSGAYVQAVNRGAKADFDWHPNPGLHFKFGASYADQRKYNASYSTPRSSDINNLYHYLRGPTQSFPQSVISGVVYPGTAFGESQSNAYPVFVLDENALRAWEADPANLAARARNYAGSNCAYDPQCTLAAFVANGSSWATSLGNNSSYTIGEKDFGAYGELVKDFQLGKIPVNVVAGLRYSRTDVSSIGVTTVLIGYEQGDTANSLTGVYLEDASGNNVLLPVTYHNSYKEWLPSLNVKFDLTPDIVFRLAATKTLSRPTLDDLAPFIGGFGGTLSERTASGGNPYLKPFTSKNLDASFEWYYSNRGAFAIAGFYKDAKDFIVPTTVIEKIPTITEPSPGINLTVDQLQTTTVNGPGNASSSKIEGVTAGWTHAFPFGLGFQLNATKLWSKATLYPGVSTTQSQTFAIPGISNTANAIVFYEKGPISARVAWNWRSAFLASPGTTSSLAIYGDAYYQIDARLGYDLGHGVDLAASVVNLTNRNVRYYAFKKQYLSALYNYGRQFTFTATKKF